MSDAYRHSQAGVGIVMIVALAALAIIIAVYMQALPRGALVAAGILLVCARVFGSLTVDVDATAIALRFGFGLVRTDEPPALAAAIRQAARLAPEWRS